MWSSFHAAKRKPESSTDGLHYGQPITTLVHNVICYVSVRTCATIGQFSGPYFTKRPAKFKSLLNWNLPLNWNANIMKILLPLLFQVLNYRIVFIRSCHLRIDCRLELMNLWFLVFQELNLILNYYCNQYLQVPDATCCLPAPRLTHLQRNTFAVFITW